jgi:hypothetical protein
MPIKSTGWEDREVLKGSPLTLGQGLFSGVRNPLNHVPG